MARILSCYYLDAPLSDAELDFVAGILLGPWARFRTGASSLSQKRVPAVLPMPDEHGRYDQTREERARTICANLRHAGIRQDNGRQVVWVVPHEHDWDAIFQFAIRTETGYGPYVVQRAADGTDMQQGMRIIDTHMLLSRL
jgi:hypothetical protein